MLAVGMKMHVAFRTIFFLIPQLSTQYQSGERPEMAFQIGREKRESGGMENLFQPYRYDFNQPHIWFIPERGMIAVTKIHQVSIFLLSPGCGNQTSWVR